MGHLPIAVVDMDLVIGVVAVIVWLIVQAVGKKNKDAPSSTPMPSEPMDSSSPGDELRKFFEDMEKAGGAEPPQPVVPPPPPPRRAARPKHAARAHVQAPPEETILPPPLVPVSASPQNAPALVPIMEPIKLHAPTHKWAKGYACPENLRKMMVAREVLGPPLALRPAAHRYGMSA
jgi:hypothetical protein